MAELITNCRGKFYFKLIVTVNWLYILLYFIFYCR